MTEIPQDLKYAKSFEWVKKEGEIFLVGISDYAQNQLGDIVYIDFPEIGEEIEMGDNLGEIESSKAVSDISMPFNGEVVEINEDMEDTPELINSNPYDSWLVKIKASDPADFDKLLDSSEFRKLLEVNE